MTKFIITVLVILSIANIKQNVNCNVLCETDAGYYWDKISNKCILLEQFEEESTVEPEWPTIPPTTTTEAPPTASPAPEPQCPVQCRSSGTYYFPHFRFCNRYYQCFYGYPLDLACPPGTIFDIDLLDCVAGGRCVLNR